MANDLIPREVDLDSAGEDFWRRYHAHRRARHAETRPDDPYLPDDLERQRVLHDRKFEVVHGFEVVQGDEMVAWFVSYTARPGAPGYEENRAFLWCRFSVLALYRRRGIGRSFLPLIVEESGHAFMKWLGAEKKMEGAENRLHIADVDWAMIQRWIDDGRQKSPETKLEIYDDHIPDAMLDEYAPQLASLLNTMPWDDLDHGPIVVTPEILRDAYERFDMMGLKHHTVLTREPNGVISGITDMNWAPHRPAILEQMFTGVRPDARGRGIGKWIKGVDLDRERRLQRADARDQQEDGLQAAPLGRRVSDQPREAGRAGGSSRLSAAPALHAAQEQRDSDDDQQHRQGRAADDSEVLP